MCQQKTSREMLQEKLLVDAPSKKSGTNGSSSKRKSVNDDEVDMPSSTKRSKTDVLADSSTASNNQRRDGRERRVIKSRLDRLEEDSARIQQNPVRPNPKDIPEDVPVNLVFCDASGQLLKRPSQTEGPQQRPQGAGSLSRGPPPQHLLRTDLSSTVPQRTPVRMEPASAPVACSMIAPQPSTREESINIQGSPDYNDPYNNIYGDLPPEEFFANKHSNKPSDGCDDDHDGNNGNNDDNERDVDVGDDHGYRQGHHYDGPYSNNDGYDQDFDYDKDQDNDYDNDQDNYDNDQDDHDNNDQGEQQEPERDYDEKQEQNPQSREEEIDSDHLDASLYISPTNGDDDEQDVLAGHWKKNRANQVPDSATLDHYRRLQRGDKDEDDEAEGSSGGRRQEEEQEDEEEEEEEEEEEPKKKTCTPQQPQPHHPGFFSRQWKQVLYFGQVGIQRGLLKHPEAPGGLGFLPPNNEATEVELGFILTVAIAHYEKQYGQLDMSYYEDETCFDGMIKLLLGELSRFHGKAKKTVRSFVESCYSLEPKGEDFQGRGFNQQESQQQYEMNIQYFSEGSRFLRAPGVDKEGSPYNFMHEGVGRTMEALTFRPPKSKKGEFAVYDKGVAAAAATAVNPTIFIFQRAHDYRSSAMCLTSWTLAIRIKNIDLDEVYGTYYASCLRRLDELESDPKHQERIHGCWKAWSIAAFGKRSWSGVAQKREVSKKVLDVPL
ncbi:hypothetical protein B0H19DRAFT_1076946 [Mycena capillaripes]|nr:hypothetical protein B0H19DRAFT_1076946 [Mycena capillaripes]